MPVCVVCNVGLICTTLDDSTGGAYTAIVCQIALEASGGLLQQHVQGLDVQVGQRSWDPIFCVIVQGLQEGEVFQR